MIKLEDELAMNVYETLQEILLTLKSIENKIEDKRDVESNVKESKSVLFTPIWECGWSTRVENCFKAYRVLFIGDLLSIHQNNRRFKGGNTIKDSRWKIIPNFGNHSFLEMKKVLKEIYNVNLNDDILEYVNRRPKYIRDNINVLIKQSLKFNHFSYCRSEDSKEEFLKDFINLPEI